MRDAGIRVVMVTGDQAMTAQAVAREVGLISDEDGGDEQTVLEGSILENPDELSEEDREAILRAPVFARVSPKQKLNLVQLYQREGDLVAMTGDGVNDAPALKTADIGVAMGQRGTQVAREASDMILQDDALSTIVVAVREGRIIFSNLRKFVTFLLSCNASEVVAIGIATLTALPLPLLPLQILLMNLVTDVLPALALGVGEGPPQRDGPQAAACRRAGADDETLARHRHVRGLPRLVTLGAFLLALNWLELEKPAAVTVGFLTLATSQLFHVNNVRDRQSSIFINEITTNHWLWGALAVSVTLLVASVTVPSLKEVFGTVTPDGPMILLILGMSVIPMILGQLYLGCRTELQSAQTTDGDRPGQFTHGRLLPCRRSLL
jgi:Ca2+-transporting ATPase